MELKSLQTIASLMDSHKQLQTMAAALQKMKLNKSCHIINFTYALDSLAQYSGDLSWDATMDDGEFCNLIVDTALKHFQEKLQASEMLLGMADMVLQRALENTSKEEPTRG